MLKPATFDARVDSAGVVVLTAYTCGGSCTRVSRFRRGTSLEFLEGEVLPGRVAGLYTGGRVWADYVRLPGDGGRLLARWAPGVAPPAPAPPPEPMPVSDPQAEAVSVSEPMSEPMSETAAGTVEDLLAAYTRPPDPPDPATMTVAEIRSHTARHPEHIPHIIRAETEGKKRATILAL